MIPPFYESNTTNKAGGICSLSDDEHLPNRAVCLLTIMLLKLCF